MMNHSVACAVGPSVNTLRAQLVFHSKPNFLQFVGISNKNQYFLHLSSENYETNSIKSDSLRAFQQHQERPQIPISFSVSILFSFH
jgi:hypothetical protein